MTTRPPRCARALFCSAAALTLLQAGAARAEIQVDVNRRAVQFGNAGPVRVDGRVFIPLRAVVEALGAEVRWSASTQTVHGSKGTREFSLPIGSRTARVNGKSMDLDAPARLMSGTTMVPLRFVAEALGAEVDWNASEQKVAISLGADAGGEGPSTPRAAETVSGELISVQPNANPPTLTLRVRGSRQTYRLGDGTRVTRGEQGARGERVDVDQLRPGDQVSIRLDDAGRMAEQIDATIDSREARRPGDTGDSGTALSDRMVRGEVIRMLPDARPARVVVMVDGARRSYPVSGAIVTHRVARRAERLNGTLKDVVTGDQVVLQLDRSGRIVERIDATHVRAR